MSKGTFTDFLSALLAFESGWDRERYETGVIQDWQLNAWAGGEVTKFFPNYTSWGDLSDTEWESMAYRSQNSLGFVGFQFGEALLIDLLLQVAGDDAEDAAHRIPVALYFA